MIVPEEFRPHIRVDYPPNNRLIFEEWFYENFELPEDELARIYLPVFWTSYYVNNNYGQDKKALQRLQDFIDSLDKSVSYFTVVQYDDGILNDLSGLDIKIFGSGGGRYDMPIPLIAQPQPYSFTSERDIFCNFIGALTHPIRRQLLTVAKKANYLFSTKAMPIQDYCYNLSRSVFTLAPRGYGLTSFRLAEAIQFGSIPVYLSDKFMIPFDKDFDYGVIIEADQVHNTDRILRAIPPEEIKRKQELLPIVYQEYFTYEGCKNQILKHI